MYYDLEAPGAVVSVTRPPPPFRVDFVCGCDAAAGDGIGWPEAHPLSQLYFCDGCSRVVSRRELAEDVDSYYCPNCLELMPSSEAMLYGMRCSKCWECPVCASTLTTAMVGAAGSEREPSYHLSCGYCRWSSRGRCEAAQPEQLFAQLVALEREGESRQRMGTLVEAFRARAQEQQRERELAQRLRRRSSFARGSFAATSIGAYAARRFSSAMMLRTPRMSPMGGSMHHGPLDGAAGASASGSWRLDDLEAKLGEQAASAHDLRAEARATARAAPAVALGEGEPGAEAGSRAAPLQSGLRKATGQQGIPELPVLEGLTVEELLRQHTEPGLDGRASLFKELQRSLDEDVDRGMEGAASLPQRLQQLAYGHVRAQAAVPAPGELRAARMQLEAPLQHTGTWALLPLRKPLLTKRSRRCRLLTRRPANVEADATAPIPEEEPADDKIKAVAPAMPSGSTAETATAKQVNVSVESGKTGEDATGGLQVCKNIVVKPQINPCFNPPFQKNNTALAFIPRCVPWMWSLAVPEEAAGGAAAVAAAGATAPAAAAGVPGAAASQRAPAAKCLQQGEAAQVVFTMSNPLDADVELQLNPRAFNSLAAEAAGAGGAAFEQNVEVLTAPFETAISRFNDLADVHEVWGEETERMKMLKAQDDPDVIPDRKLHKILVRLRFRALPAAKDAQAQPGAPSPWVFFVKAALIFTDAASAKHEVRLVLRFAAEAPNGPVLGGAALLSSAQ